MDDIRTEVAKSAKKELVIAGIATVITLFLAVGMYFVVPSIQGSMRSKSESLNHSRSFTGQPDGGLIKYSVPAAVKDQSLAAKSYKQDLEILSRRFSRGQYDMATLPGFRSGKLYKDLVAVGSKYSYSVSVEGNGASLKISSSNKEATEVLHRYLAYLDKNWKY